MDSLAELQRRKAELKAQIEQQKLDLKKTFVEAREEIEPANLLKKAVTGIFSTSKNKKDDTTSGLFKQLPLPVSIIADLLIKDPKIGLLVKLAAPLAVKFFQKKAKKQGAEETPALPAKARLLGGLRQSISTFRTRLRKGKKADEQLPEKEPTSPIESPEK